MNIKEALAEIKSRVKPYAQVGMPQSSFTNTIRNIEAGLAKQSTIETFMLKFGYTKVEIQEEWEVKSW